MRICRFQTNDAIPRWGIIASDDAIVEISTSGKISGDCLPDPIPLNSVRLLAPCLPSKIVCVGLNYRDHAKEMGKDLPEEPIIFLKPPTSVAGPNDFVILPNMSEHVDYEAELALVVGKIAKNIRAEDAKDYILGYTCLNDVTARDLQLRDVQYTRAKGFDSFCPIGPWIETALDTSSLKIFTRINGIERQYGNTSQLIFSPIELLSFVSKIMTLLPGDVIATGTPAGVGSLSDGDLVEVEIESIGILQNIVRRG